MHKTDNCGRQKKIVSVFLSVLDLTTYLLQYRYHEFSRCQRQWRNLKMLKRGAAAHNPAGIHATKQGALAVECPACPQPGRNMPTNFNDIPEEDRYVLALYFINFR